MTLTWDRSRYDRCCKPTMAAEFEANLNQTVAEGNAVEYRLSAFGTYACPAKFDAIPDKAICVQAANSVQRIFDDHFSHHKMTDHPYGCLHDRNARISFNPNGNKQHSTVTMALCAVQMLRPTHTVRGIVMAAQRSPRPFLTKQLVGWPHNAEPWDSMTTFRLPGQRLGASKSLEGA
mmetsp:Transcript_24927/g.77498  ORF Transcript_24927/g.77498 Transcript_24927/m.77498 type:complete len:177 (-) Transcript_24927:687-1217(-)